MLYKSEPILINTHTWLSGELRLETWASAVLCRPLAMHGANVINTYTTTRGQAFGNKSVRFFAYFIDYISYNLKLPFFTTKLRWSYKEKHM